MAALEPMRPSTSTTATFVMSKTPRLMSNLTLDGCRRNRNDPSGNVRSGACSGAHCALPRADLRPMPTRSLKQDDPLEDFTRLDVTFDAICKAVYVAGAGPAVIVM